MKYDKEEIYNTLKNMTLEELLGVFDSSNKTEIPTNNMKTDSLDDTILYTTNDLLDKYPFFTRYNLNKAIQDGGLPYCIIGNKRMFNKGEIEKWIEKETKPKKEKMKYEI